MLHILSHMYFRHSRVTSVTSDDSKQNESSSKIETENCHSGCESKVLWPWLRCLKSINECSCTIFVTSCWLNTFVSLSFFRFWPNMTIVVNVKWKELQIPLNLIVSHFIPVYCILYTYFTIMFQGTIGCTPNSVPMVLIGLI